MGGVTGVIGVNFFPADPARRQPQIQVHRPGDRDDIRAIRMCMRARRTLVHVPAENVRANLLRKRPIGYLMHNVPPLFSRRHQVLHPLDLGSRAGRRELFPCKHEHARKIRGAPAVLCIMRLLKLTLKQLKLTARLMAALDTGDHDQFEASGAKSAINWLGQSR